MLSTRLVSSISDEKLGEIVRLLAEALSPRAIYLFGSQEYGTPGPDSDVDILVLVEDSRLSSPDLDERGYRALRGMFLPLELHIHGYEGFTESAGEAGSFEHEVLSRGRVLYARKA